jgi:tetratricopeptide (TPR) repeat protein
MDHNFMSKYHIKTIPKNVNNVEELVNKIISALFTKELYPTYRFIDYVINNLNENDIFETIGCMSRQQWISIYNTSIVDHQVGRAPDNCLGFTPIFPNGEIVDYKWSYDNTAHVILTDKLKDYYEYILKNIMVPTTYITPIGDITIDWDIDIYTYYMYYHQRVPADYDRFMEMINMRLHVMQKNYFFRYSNFYPNKEIDNGLVTPLIAKGNQGDAYSYYQLGILYGDIKDYLNMKKYFEESIKLDYDSPAKEALADYYDDIEKDYEMAIKLYDQIPNIDRDRIIVDLFNKLLATRGDKIGNVMIEILLSIDEKYIESRANLGVKSLYKCLKIKLELMDLHFNYSLEGKGFIEAKNDYISQLGEGE